MIFCISYENLQILPHFYTSVCKCLLEMLPKPSRNIVLQFAVGQVAENSLRLFENADVILLARLLQVSLVEIRFSLNTALL